MGTLYDYLDILRLRPWMYIGNNTITTLHTHIDGYRQCLREKWIEENEQPRFEMFGDWVARYYDSESPSKEAWSAQILQHSMDEEVALMTFFILLEKFKVPFMDL